MKAVKRKLLSLVLAMAMVLSLAPTALAGTYAETTPGWHNINEAHTNAESGHVQSDVADETVAATCGADGYKVYPCQATGCRAYYVEANGSATGNHTKDSANPGYSQGDANNHTYACSVCSNAVPEPHDYTSGPCVCGKAAPSTAGVVHTVTLSRGSGWSGTSNSLQSGGSATIIATAYDSDGKSVVFQSTDITWNVPNNGLITSTATGSTLSITANSNLQTGGTVEITATIDGKTSAKFAVNVTTAASKSASLTPPTSTIAVGGTQTLTVTLNGYTSSDYDYIRWNVSQAANYITYTSSTTYVNTNVFTGYMTGTATVSASLMKTGVATAVYTTNSVTINVGSSGAYLTGNPTVGTTVPLDSWNGYDSSVRSRTFTVVPHFDTLTSTELAARYTITYDWYLGTAANPQAYHLSYGGSYANGSSYTLYSNEAGLYYNGGYAYGVLTCVATYTSRSLGVSSTSATASWTIGNGYTGSIFASATVYRSSGSYALGGQDDAGKSSIVSQLDSYFYNSGAYRYGYGLSHVQFLNTTDSTTGSSLSATAGTSYYVNYRNTGTSYALSNVLLYPGNTIGTATFRIRAYYYTSSAYSTTDYVDGAITFVITGETYSGDITYSGSIGSDVAFHLKDFEDFYYNRTRGTLTHVSFTLPSGGYLYSDGGRLNTSNACYVSPTRNQTDLAGVYFSPTGTTATRANTVRISFTAYGTRSNTSGTVVITYLSGSAKDITYNIYTSGALKASDFTDAYRQVVGSAAPTGLTIEFQSVPAFGSLSYKDSSRANSTAVSLRSSNIKSYKFTTLATGTNQLGDVTYTASGNHSDTIDYIAYVNNTPQFTGKVIFNGSSSSAANMQVTFTSSNGKSVDFSYVEFSKANAAVIAMTSYIRFVTMPSGGTLTYNGAVMTLSSTNVPPTSLGSVSYRPSAGFNNSTDRVSFLCYDANGNNVGSGQVNIVVTGNTNPNNSSAGTTNVNQFKDVSANAWYRDYLSRLVSAGIIKGKGDGKFDPDAKLTYGEALKIFMLASGYPTQAEPSGQNWAINYKNQAVSNNWISKDVDLNAQISRNAMAELVAKSLGVSPTDGVPAAWKDGTSNGYSNALYYTNPQILVGNNDGTFKGTSTLSRDQICAIACRVMDYKNNQQSTDRPGWIS